MKYKALFLFAAALCSGVSPEDAAAQNQKKTPLSQNSKPQGAFVTVTGFVTDDSGMPIIGANIWAKASSTGTSSDLDGKFTIKVPVGEQLTVSYIGCVTQQIKVTKALSLTIKLESEAMDLDEVVVVGYGTQKKEHVTGSVTQVSAKELTKVPMTNVSNMLVGKLPGLAAVQNSGQPGADQASISIRSYGTFNDSSPLLLVDGVERTFNTMDPNDIESVTILKDAAASAVYGVRAAHGVILVKTKRGSKDQKANITYSGSLTFSTNTRFPKFLNAPDYARWHNKARQMDNHAPYFSEEDIAKMEAGYDPDGIFGNTDWVDLAFKNFGATQQHNISAVGGNEKVQYFVSGGFMDQDGIVKNTNFKRWNLRANIDVQISNNLKLSMNMAGRMQEQKSPGFSISSDAYNSPIMMATRTLPIIPETYNGLPAAWGGEGGTRTFNPVAALESSGFNQNKKSVFESQMTLAYDIPFIKGLQAKMFVSFDKDFTETKGFLTPYKVATFDIEKRQYNTVTAEGTGNGSLFQSASSGQKFMLRPSIEYTNTFGKHDVNALFLYEQTENDGGNMQAQRKKYLLTDLAELSMGLEDVENSIRGSSSASAMAGFVGRLNYAYAKKYLAEFAFRADGSYKFAKEHRWGFFPSLSLGWLMSEEAWFRNALPKIDKFKVRGSVGLLGRDNTAAFLYKRLMALTASPSYIIGETYTSVYGLYTLNSIPSSTLTWEKTQTWNGGVEMTMWNGLLSVDLDAFYKYTYDILENVSATYPPSLGGNFPSTINSGSVSVKGFELKLGHRNRIHKVNYSVDGYLTYAKNKVLSRLQSSNLPEWQSLIGHPIGEIRGFKAIGLYQTQEQLDNRPEGPGGTQRLGDIMYEDINGDGKIDSHDMVVIGHSSLPDMNFSLNMNVEWNGFDISMLWQGAAMRDVAISGAYASGTNDQTQFSRPFYGNGNSPYYLLENSWTPENTDAAYPRLGVDWNSNNAWASSWWIRNGSYLRLKNAQVGYSVPSRILKCTGLQRLRVYVSGTNLLTFDHLKYLDPEMPNVNNGYYPQQRTYSVGLNATF